MRTVEAQLIHDMRNVAAVIRGAAETLHGSHLTLPPANIDHMLAMLARRSDMLVRLLEDLATVDALDRGDLALELQAVDLREAVRDVVTAHRQRSEGSITVDIVKDAVALGDPVRITQILDNLLSNAGRYGGPHVTVRAWRDGHQVHVVVHDDGAGVAPDLVDSLFDLYSRGSASRLLGGSGLGLAIVQELCRVLGGTIAYDGAEGATFTASLPAVPMVAGPLGQDAARAGHAVCFWADAGTLADSVADYTASGLVDGQAVVIAVTDDHR